MPRCRSARFCARWPANFASRPDVPPPPRYRPRFDQLEDRVTPASLLWTNATGDGLYATAANWHDLGGGASAVPGQFDYEYFGFSGSGSNTACTITGSHDVDRVIMDSTYTSTLTVANGADLDVTNFIQQYGTLIVAGGGSIDAGTNYYINGDLGTSGNGTASITTTGGFTLEGSLTAIGPATLSVTAGTFTDHGPITVGSSGGQAGTLDIHATVTGDSTIDVFTNSTLSFLTSGVANPQYTGTIDLAGGTIATDGQLQLGGTMNVTGNASTFAGDLAVINGGVVNIGSTSGGMPQAANLIMSTGSLLVGCTTTGGTSTAGTVNIKSSSNLIFPALQGTTSLCFIGGQGVINLYGANLIATVSRVAAVENHGTIHSEGANVPSPPNDAINGNLSNFGTVEFGGALHTLTIGRDGTGAGGNFTQGSTGTLKMRLDEGPSGPTNDVLAPIGNGTLGGTLQLVQFNPNNPLVPGSIWRLITPGGTNTGNFATIIPATGGPWRVVSITPYAVGNF